MKFVITRTSCDYKTQPLDFFVKQALLINKHTKIVDKAYLIDISDIRQLIDLCKQVGEEIIIKNESHLQGLNGTIYPEIEIYDGYRE